MKTKEIKKAIYSFNESKNETEIPQSVVPIKEDEEQIECVELIGRKDIEQILTKSDILEASQGYYTDFFFEKYVNLRNVLISNNVHEDLDEFFSRVNNFFSQVIRTNGVEIPKKPLDYIYKLLLNQLDTNENKIISLRGYHGSGKSKFCEGLFFYLLSKYDETKCVPFIFNTDACLENLSKGRDVWLALKEELSSMVDLIKRQLTHSKVILILDGVFDPKQLAKDTVMKMIQKEIAELYRHSSFKIVISEDVEDYFLEGISDERNWLSCKREMTFSGLNKKNKESIATFVNSYCELYAVFDSDRKIIVDRVVNSYPLFRVDSKFIRNLLEAKRNFFDIAQYYYTDVFQLDRSENERNLNTKYTIEVVKDIFVDGQIGDSWQTKGAKELLLILNDDYAFYFFVAYVFMNKWLEANNIQELERDDVFKRVLVNQRFRLLDRRIIFFITYLFQEETTATKIRLIEKFKDFVTSIENDWYLMPEKRQSECLHFVNVFMFVLAKCFSTHHASTESQRMSESYVDLFQVITKFSGNFQASLILDLWENDNSLNRAVCSFLHCLHYFAIAGYYDDATLKVISNAYFYRIITPTSPYQRILDNLGDSFVAYWGINNMREDAFEQVLNELLFELSFYNEGKNQFYNELDVVINCEIVRKMSDKPNAKKFLSNFITEVIKDKTENDFAINGFYDYLINLLND